MPMEIERKFLVASEEWRSQASGSAAMRQAVIIAEPGRVLRIRTYGDGRARLTIKIDESGFSRHEFEYDIPFDHAAELVDLAEGRVIAKTRHEVAYHGFVWEIDCYEGDLDGLVVAEVELSSETDQPDLPPWIGTEVTADPRFSNKALAEGSLGKDWRNVLPD
jgi:CYTH domain-containing protein